MNAVDLRTLAERVAAMPAVAGLSHGPWGTVAVHLPGERIPGLRLDGDRLAAVHVVLAAGATVAEAATEVAAAVALFTDPARVELHVDDVALPDEAIEAPAAVEPAVDLLAEPAVDPLVEPAVDPLVEELAADAPLFRTGVA